MSFAQMHNDYLDPDRHNGPAHIFEPKPRKEYQVAWDNGHASGVFQDKYTSKRAAAARGAEWKRNMLDLERSLVTRAEARRAYQWEIIEAQPDTEEIPE